MRIAYMINGFPVLSETFILNQITGLIDRGHKVDIYPLSNISQSKVHPDILNYKLLDSCYYRTIPKGKTNKILSIFKILVSINRRKRKSLLKTLNFLKYGKESLTLFFSASVILSNDSYDVVHCHFGPNGNIASKLKEIGIIECPVITTFHGYDITMYIKEKGNSVYNHLFKNGDFFLPISYNWKDSLIKLGCPEDKIEVHRMGVDLSNFIFEKKDKQNKKIKVLTIARLVEKKGVEYGIKAILGLLSKNYEIEYLIIGDGPLKQDLEKMVPDKYSEDIKFLGWKSQDEIKNEIKNSDVLMQPSVTSSTGDQEGIPVVMMEAMAMGLPILTTKHSGIPELVENSISGYLVPERDVNELMEKLELLLNDSRLRIEMGINGRMKVESDFNINRLNDQLAETFQKTIMSSTLG